MKIVLKFQYFFSGSEFLVQLELAMRERRLVEIGEAFEGQF